jgi:hypothetical protein
VVMELTVSARATDAKPVAVKLGIPPKAGCD